MKLELQKLDKPSMVFGLKIIFKLARQIYKKLRKSKQFCINDLKQYAKKSLKYNKSRSLLCISNNFKINFNVQFSKSSPNLSPRVEMDFFQLDL